MVTVCDLLEGIINATTSVDASLNRIKDKIDIMEGADPAIALDVSGAQGALSAIKSNADKLKTALCEMY